MAALDHAVRAGVNGLANVQSPALFHGPYDTMSSAPAGLGALAPKIMSLSTERILTTHVGSLPRTSELVALLYKKDAGEPYDRAAYDSAVAVGVAEAVAKQLAAGVDIVSDGETSKVGYATYIKDRLSGFADRKSVV